jgi:hypothetical protein
LSYDTDLPFDCQPAGYTISLGRSVDTSDEVLKAEVRMPVLQRQLHGPDQTAQVRLRRSFIARCFSIDEQFLMFMNMSIKLFLPAIQAAFARYV